MAGKGLHLNLKAEFCSCSCLGGFALGSSSMQVYKNISLYGGEKMKILQ